MNFHPPFSESSSFSFFLIPQILIGSNTLLQKFTPHLKILDPRLHCRQKPKTKDYIDEKPQTVQDTKTEEPQFSSAKTEKPNQTLAKSAKPKIPTAPSTSCQALPRVCDLRQKRLAIKH